MPGAELRILCLGGFFWLLEQTSEDLEDDFWVPSRLLSHSVKFHLMPTVSKAPGKQMVGNAETCRVLGPIGTWAPEEMDTGKTGYEHE